MPIDVLSKTDVRNEIAADCYQGGLLFHAHGGVHPRFSSRECRSARVAPERWWRDSRPRPRCAATRERFVVETPRGNLRAGAVVIATNGYTGATTRALARRLVAIPSFLIATEPLGRDTRAFA